MIEPNMTIDCEGPQVVAVKTDERNRRSGITGSGAALDAERRRVHAPTA